MAIKAIIIEDERLARNELKKLLQDHSDIEVIEEAANVDDGIEKNKHKSSFKPSVYYPNDPVRQYHQATTVLDTSLVNFEGGNWSYRPDANGAVGPNNYVQAVNLCNYNIYDKLGNLLLSTDMTTLGGDCSDDPIIHYDKFADRWVMMDVTYSYQNLSIAVSATEADSMSAGSRVSTTPLLVRPKSCHSGAADISSRTCDPAIVLFNICVHVSGVFV